MDDHWVADMQAQIDRLRRIHAEAQKWNRWKDSGAAQKCLLARADDCIERLQRLATEAALEKVSTRW